MLRAAAARSASVTGNVHVAAALQDLPVDGQHEPGVLVTVWTISHPWTAYPAPSSAVGLPLQLIGRCRIAQHAHQARDDHSQDGERDGEFRT